MLFGSGRSYASDDGGTYLVEAAIGMLVMSVAVLGVLGSFGSGLSLVGHSRQRSAAVGLAQERLERFHNLPFQQIATKFCSPVTPECQNPAYNDSTTNPDHNVTTDGLSYKVDASTTEPLIQLANMGGNHIDDPTTVGKTEYSVYQYVTWVDDPDITGTQNYKRVTVVAIWKFPVHSGTSHQVTQSTFIGDTGTTVAETTPAPTPTGAPATPTPTPTPVPTATPPCAGDVTGPSGSMTIVSGAGAAQGFTNSNTVQVQVTATDACAPIVADLWNSNTSTWTQGVANLTSGAQSTIAVSVGSGDGSKTVSVRFRDGVSNASPTYSGSIILDQMVPTIPGNLRLVSCALNGNTRTVTLTWNAASDANFLGYRPYRQIDTAPYTQLATTGTQSFSDSHTKTSQSTNFVVRTYDKAGNESGSSNVRTFSKNSCT